MLRMGSVLGTGGSVLELQLVLSDMGSTPDLTELSPAGPHSLPRLKKPSHLSPVQGYSVSALSCKGLIKDV